MEEFERDILELIESKKIKVIPDVPVRFQAPPAVLSIQLASSTEPAVLSHSPIPSGPPAPKMYVQIFVNGKKMFVNKKKMKDFLELMTT